jgi:hypothetical protein
MDYDPPNLKAISFPRPPLRIITLVLLAVPILISASALAAEEGWQLLGYLRPITQRVLCNHREDLAALAEELLKHNVISGRRVWELLRERGVRQW